MRQDLQDFVYDKGDKLDWNHPNRAGHRLIADYVQELGILDAKIPVASGS